MWEKQFAKGLIFAMYVRWRYGSYLNILLSSWASVLAVNSSIFIWIILFVYLFFVIQKTSETSITFLLIAHDFLLNILILLCFFSCLALCTKILLYLNILHGSTSIIFFPYRSCGRIISPTSAELSYYTAWSFFHTCK